MRLWRTSLLASCTLVLIAAGPNACRELPDDPDVDSFATWEHPLPPARGGMLLRAEPLDPDHDFFQIVPTFDGSAHRILHTTVDGNGDPATSTGVVLIPAGTAPNGGWPVIAWAHGTVGVSDCIAPSRTDGPDVEGGGYASSWAAWLSEGYAVVASDYAGHGTQGETFYIDGRSQAYNTADAVGAARRLIGGAELSKRYLVTGHSQGGQTAMFAAAVNREYAPDLKLVGAIAFSPAVGWAVDGFRIQDRLDPSGQPPHALIGFEKAFGPGFLDKIVAGLLAYDYDRDPTRDQFVPEEFFTAPVIEAAALVAGSPPCGSGFVPPGVTWALIDDDPNGALVQDPATAWVPFVDRWDPPLEPSAYDAPLYILTGEADPITPLRAIQPFIDALFIEGDAAGGYETYPFVDLGGFGNWLGDHFGFNLEPDPYADGVEIAAELFAD